MLYFFPEGLQIGNRVLKLSNALFMSFIRVLSRSQADFLRAENKWFSMNKIKLNPKCYHTTFHLHSSSSPITVTMINRARHSPLAISQLITWLIWLVIRGHRNSGWRWVVDVLRVTIRIAQFNPICVVGVHIHHWRCWTHNYRLHSAIIQHVVRRVVAAWIQTQNCARLIRKKVRGLAKTLGHRFNNFKIQGLIFLG